MYILFWLDWKPWFHICGKPHAVLVFAIAMRFAQRQCTTWTANANVLFELYLQLVQKNNPSKWRWRGRLPRKMSRWTVVLFLNYLLYLHVHCVTPPWGLTSPMKWSAPLSALRSLKPGALHEKFAPREAVGQRTVPIFAYHDGVKVNTLTFTQLEALGIYMVTAKFGFTMKYLKMTYYRFLRGNLAPGQETSVRGMLVDDGEQALHPQRFQAHLMRALEGYALAKDCPGKVVPFEIDHPASFQKLSPKPFLFPPPQKVTALSFDGHFGVHRKLHKDLEDERTVALRGRPKKHYQHDERTCTCANKDKQRLTLQNRTGGWQFVIDPLSRHVVAAMEHAVNESTAEKAYLISETMKMQKVNPDLLIHDDACHFEGHVQKSKKWKSIFKKIRYYVIDEFHRVNHKCCKKHLTKSEAKKLKRVRTNMSEVFNAWMRRKNFILNSMNAYSHRFWVNESIKFWNQNLGTMPKYVTRRSTATTQTMKRKAMK